MSERRYHEGAVLALDVDISVRPHRDWERQIGAISERIGCKLLTALDRNHRVAVRDPTGRKMVPTWVLLSRRPFSEINERRLSDELSVRQHGEAWMVFWTCIHPINGYPFDLRHPAHVKEAMSILERYAAWTPGEVALKAGELRRDMHSFLRDQYARERIEERSKWADALRPVARELEEAVGRPMGSEFARKVDERAAAIPAYEEALAAYYSNPNDATQAAADAAADAIRPVTSSEVAGG